MGAHTTLTIPRTAALEKLATLDLSDLPDAQRQWVDEFFPTLTMTDSKKPAWETYSNEELEQVLDYLLYDTLYNFTVLDDGIFNYRVKEEGDDLFLVSWCRGIMYFDWPSLVLAEIGNLSEGERKLFDDLDRKGYGRKEILTLLRSKSNDSN